MKRLMIYLLLSVTLFMTQSFVSGVKITDKNIKTADSKYYYFRVSTLDRGYYFSNVTEVEPNENGSTYDKMMKMKKLFKSKLQSEYNLDWPLSNITSYEWSNTEAAEKDRKNRISQAGKDVKFIEL